MQTPWRAALAVLSTASVHAKKAVGRPDAGAGNVASRSSLCSRTLTEAQSRPGKGEFSASHWNIEYKADGEAARSYAFRLLSDGTMLNNHPNESTPDNDRWESKGRYVLLRFNDSYVVYSGVLNKAGNQLQGQAVNQVGDSWKWRARRLPNC